MFIGYFNIWFLIYKFFYQLDKIFLNNLLFELSVDDNLSTESYRLTSYWLAIVTHIIGILKV